MGSKPFVARNLAIALPRLSASLFLAFFWMAAPASAELTVPVTVYLTELVQLNQDQDPGVFGIGQSLADFYAEVTINGTTLSNFADRCDNPPPTPPAQSVFSVPYFFFTEDGVVSDPSCRNVPWTFVVDVPLRPLLYSSGVTVDVVIRIKDSDDDDDDTPATVNLTVPLGNRWSGDVFWPNNCNRPAVAGSGARVCWEIEVGSDADGDGLFDDWEQSGIDFDENGVIEPNGADLVLSALGADPMHKDLFVELDWRAGFPPKRAEVQKWKAAFAAAPIDAGGIPNPDGLPGINLHVDTGGLTEGGLPVGDNLGGGNQLPAGFPVCSLSVDQGAFYSAKAAHFDSSRRDLVFRYGITSTNCCLFGTNYGLPCTSDAQCAGAICQNFGGQAEIGGNDFVVWNDAFQGSLLMHELGHTLNLRHGGDVDDNCKPNYVSIMNYHHFVIERLDGTDVLDFSPARLPDGTRPTAPLPPLVENCAPDTVSDNCLDETAILDPADPQNFLQYTDATQMLRRALVGAPIDWTGDGNPVSPRVVVNVDLSDGGSGVPERCDLPANLLLRTVANPLTGHDDWTNISLPFLQFGESEGGPINPVETPEPTDAQILRHLQAANTADLVLAKTGPTGPVEAGASIDLSYTLEATNRGPNPALVLALRDTLPPDSVLVTHDPACAEDPAGTLACDLSALLPGQTASVALSVRAPAQCAGGVPTPIVNEATAQNGAQYAGTDADPSDNTATVSTLVVDTTPPQLTLSASPSQLWAPNHKLVPVTITVTSHDACDDSPTIRLISITSNQSTNALGDGTTSPDVEDAAFGTDDRTFSLRAERSGTKKMRVYSIVYEAEDGSGNKSQQSVTVSVPRS